MLSGLTRRIERFFYKKGLHAPELLFLLRTQIFIAAAAFIIGLALIWHTNWFIFFALGCALAAYNFWALAKFTQQLLFSGQSYSHALVVRQFFSFLGRFLLTAALFIIFRKAIIPLAAGLSSFMLVLMFWSFTRLGKTRA